MPWGDLVNDFLSGGAGKDTFIFNTKANTSANHCKILDFRHDPTGERNLQKLGPGALKRVAFHAGTKSVSVRSQVTHLHPRDRINASK
jgi:hypothetical protein